MRTFTLTATVTVTAPEDYNTRMVEDIMSLAIWHAGDDNDTSTDGVTVEAQEVAQ